MTRILLKIFIGFLTLTALIAIGCVLMGEFGEFQLKILATTFSVSAASICAMACAAFIERRHIMPLGILGILGILLSVLAAGLVVFGVWIEVDIGGYWKFTFTTIVSAIGFGYALLLTLPNLKPAHSWTQYAACACIGIVSLMVIVAVWAEIDFEGYYRLLAVISIIMVLFTLLIPILMKFAHKETVHIEQLILVKSADGTYTDAQGQQYRVERMEPFIR